MLSAYQTLTLLYCGLGTPILIFSFISHITKKKLNKFGNYNYKEETKQIW